MASGTTKGKTVTLSNGGKVQAIIKWETSETATSKTFKETYIMNVVSTIPKPNSIFDFSIAGYWYWQHVFGSSDPYVENEYKIFREGTTQTTISAGQKTIATKTFTIKKAHSPYTVSTVCLCGEYFAGINDKSSMVQCNGTVPALASYSITYNLNGGTGTVNNQTKWYGESLTLQSTKPTRTGYTFKSWNTSASGSGTTYNPGANYTANAGLTLYAIWEPNKYTVTYNANGGTGSIANQTKLHDTPLTLSNGSGISKAGYVLYGWATSANSTVAQYAPGGSYIANSAVTLYAVWVEATIGGGYLPFVRQNGAWKPGTPYGKQSTWKPGNNILIKHGSSWQ